MYRIHNFHSKFRLEPLHYIYFTPQATAVKAWGPIAKVVRRGGQPVVNFIASLCASEATAPVFFHFKANEGLYNDELDELLKYMQVCFISLCSVLKCD